MAKISHSNPDKEPHEVGERDASENDETTLPCPFCGGDPEVQEWQDSGMPAGFAVLCSAEACGVNPCAEAETESDAIAAWNRRYPASNSSSPIMDFGVDACRSAEYLCSARSESGHRYVDGGCDECHNVIDGALRTPLTPPAVVPEVTKAENLLLGLHKIVADMGPYFAEPLTEESLPRWLALDSAQKTVAQYFALSHPTQEEK